MYAMKTLKNSESLSSISIISSSFAKFLEFVIKDSPFSFLWFPVNNQNED